MVDQQERERLKRETQESFAEHKERQNELKEAVAEEHAGEKVKTKTTLAGDVVVDISLYLDGELMDRMADVEAEINAWEQNNPSFRGASEVADNCSQVLADVVDDPAMNKRYFYEVYEETGLQGLGALVENVFSAVEEEQERMDGAMDGFRPK
jgi:hypothetical protein